MRHLAVLKSLLPFVLFSATGAMPAQQTQAAENRVAPRSVEAALQRLSAQSGVTFVGTVTDIRRSEQIGAAAGVVEIDFQVEQAIQGAPSGSVYTLREWGGLWIANGSRYTVGQHLLMFLHAPSASGLSSPVSGMDGAIPVLASGSGITAENTSAGSSEPLVDLRWIATRVVRPTVYRASSAVRSPIAAAHIGDSASVAAAEAAASPDASAASIPAQQIGISSVVAMLRSWAEAADAR